MLSTRAVWWRADSAALVTTDLTPSTNTGSALGRKTELLSAAGARFPAVSATRVATSLTCSADGGAAPDRLLGNASSATVYNLAGVACCTLDGCTRAQYWHATDLGAIHLAFVAGGTLNRGTGVVELNTSWLLADDFANATEYAVHDVASILVTIHAVRLFLDDLAGSVLEAERCGTRVGKLAWLDGVGLHDTEGQAQDNEQSSTQRHVFFFVLLVGLSEDNKVNVE